MAEGPPAQGAMIDREDPGAVLGGAVAPAARGGAEIDHGFARGGRAADQAIGFLHLEVGAGGGLRVIRHPPGSVEKGLAGDEGAVEVDLEDKQAPVRAENDAAGGLGQLGHAGKLLLQPVGEFRRHPARPAAESGRLARGLPEAGPGLFNPLALQAGRKDIEDLQRQGVDRGAPNLDRLPQQQMGEGQIEPGRGRRRPDPAGAALGRRQSGREQFALEERLEAGLAGAKHPRGLLPTGNVGNAQSDGRH